MVFSVRESLPKRIHCINCNLLTWLVGGVSGWGLVFVYVVSSAAKITTPPQVIASY